MELYGIVQNPNPNGKGFPRKKRALRRDLTLAEAQIELQDFLSRRKNFSIEKMETILAFEAEQDKDFEPSSSEPDVFTYVRVCDGYEDIYPLY